MGKVMYMRKGETHEAPSTGILASDIAVGSTVKLMENTGYAEYLVINQGIPSNSSLYDSSCDGMWLLRKSIYTSTAWDSTNNDYANSDIHSYLNNTFIGVLGSLEQSLVKSVKIPYRAGPGPGRGATGGANGLSTKIFLLSAPEVNWPTSVLSNSPGDGACVSYFNGCALTDEKRGGTSYNWWLRSPHCNESYGVNGAIYVGSSGGPGGYYVWTSYQIRPAFVLPSNALFDTKTLVLTGVK